MMRSLFSGVSGLKNHQTRMDVIGNNISNVNTTGFKSSRVNFADSLSQTLTSASAANGTLAGTNPKQIGLGSVMSSIDVNFKDGSVQSTGLNTDLCLSGNALFIVQQGNQTYYTRNGAFLFDADGNFVNSDGLYVQGFMNNSVTEHDAINTNGGISNITVRAGKSMPSAQTESIDYINNLNASTPTIESMTVTASDGSTSSPTEATIDGTNNVSAVLTLSDGTNLTVTSGTYTVGHSVPISTTVNVYDSLGAKHVVPVTVEKTGADKWLAKLSGATYPTSGDPYLKITEDDGTTTTITMTDTTIPFTSEGAFDTSTGGTGTMKLTYTNGAADQSVTVTYANLTQYANSSTINAEADGYAAGTLESVSIDKSGIVYGTYTNGVLRQEAQIAVAQFTNASGLTKNGNSLYLESQNSGTPNVGTSSGFGVTITASALEMSNVDVANEFSDMIITQRGFQSNSKIITVSDELLETLINMKR
ncbi:MAG: flagellar hook protein FlgE [Anaerovibrio sp.]|uniref:flagellar hook protein FlgE n=1 Tax=Anaerovibrio sp. TaxID=1872532 RepID=UPI0025F852D1|nr:flagellar hook protein FlgE [Anaerovibrio sp.]MCR5175910.1 flagellar hook protein FlgE [Anaerovibrio sp.]